MRRRDNAYWQRLRRDRRSNVAAVLAILAALAATLSVVALAVPGSHAASRGNPLYWALMLPMAWWGSGLTTFSPRAVRLWKPVLALSVLAAGTSLLAALRQEADWAIWAVAFGITLAAAAGSLALLRGSLVAREGPAR